MLTFVFGKTFDGLAWDFAWGPGATHDAADIGAAWGYAGDLAANDPDGATYQPRCTFQLRTDSGGPVSPAIDYISNNDLGVVNNNLFIGVASQAGPLVSEMSSVLGDSYGFTAIGPG